MRQDYPDCTDCIRYDAEAHKRDPDYVCSANRRPFPRLCYDSHKRVQPEPQKKRTGRPA